MHFILYLFAPNYSRLGTHIDRGIAEPHRYLERLTHFGMIPGIWAGAAIWAPYYGLLSVSQPSVPSFSGVTACFSGQIQPHLLEPFSHTSQSLNAYSGQSWGGGHVSEVEGGEGKGRAPSCVTVRGFWWGKLMESGGERRTSCSASIYKTVICGSVSGRQKRRGVAGWAGSLFSFMTHTQPNCENPLCVETPGQICLRQTLGKNIDISQWNWKMAVQLSFQQEQWTFSTFFCSLAQSLAPPIKATGVTPLLRPGVQALWPDSHAALAWKEQKWSWTLLSAGQEQSKTVDFYKTS